ncbi:MAG: transposase [Acidobacteria bacterium]|nr:transposase [Acidobacteriota bacterium]
MLRIMPRGLRRFPQARCLHFLTFSCYRREARLGTELARNTFEAEVERVRKWYGLYVAGYVVMPEHVHLLVSEPERTRLPVAIQMLKQNVARKLGPGRFWQARYYDFLVWSPEKRIEKLKYMHRNPVERRLVERPEDWPWSSFLHYATGPEGTVQIESDWTARRRERMGVTCASPNLKTRPTLSLQKRERQGWGSRG